MVPTFSLRWPELWVVLNLLCPCHSKVVDQVSKWWMTVCLGELGSYSPLLILFSSFHGENLSHLEVEWSGLK